MTRDPLSDEAITRAMQAAADMARNGTREERSGIFNPTPLFPKTDAGEQPAPRRKPAAA
jgi:hypothetical protein